jgi:hypothetical protein
MDSKIIFYNRFARDLRPSAERGWCKAPAMTKGMAKSEGPREEQETGDLPEENKK